VGYFGASTGAAAALWAAATDPAVAAVVSRGGRLDLAAPCLEQVRAPTLLVVGGRDAVVLEVRVGQQQRDGPAAKVPRRLGCAPAAAALRNSHDRVTSPAKTYDDRRQARPRAMWCLARVPGLGLGPPASPASRSSSIPDEAFGDRVRARCLDWGAEDVDIGAGEHGVEGGSELGISVADQELELLGAVAEVDEQVRACWVTQAPVGWAVIPAR
jgi:hypothetical protein